MEASNFKLPSFDKAYIQTSPGGWPRPAARDAGEDASGKGRWGQWALGVGGLGRWVGGAYWGGGGWGRGGVK